MEMLNQTQIISEIPKKLSRYYQIELGTTQK